MNRPPLKPLVAAGATTALIATAAFGTGFVSASNQAGVTPAASAAVAAQTQPTEPGVLIASVELGGPAAAAGIVRGNILLQIGGTPVNTPADVRAAIKDRTPGEAVDLTVQHSDETRTRSVTLGDRDGSAYLGITPCGPGHAGRAIFLGGPGAVVMSVAEGSPAANAGIQDHDQIVAVDGQDVQDAAGLTEQIAAKKPGDTVSVTVNHPERGERTLPVTLGQHPEAATKAYLGVQMAPLFGRLPDGMRSFEGGTPGDRLIPHLPEGVESGAVVRRVAEGSPAAAAGLAEGDIITAIDGQTLDRPRALTEAVAAKQPGDTITLTVRGRDADQTRDLAVTLGEHPEQAGVAYLGVEAAGVFNIRRGTDGENGPALSERELCDFFESAAPFDLPLPPANGEMQMMRFSGGSL